MEQRKYDKATAEAIFKMTSWPESWALRDEGVFASEAFRTHSPSELAFDWTAASDMDWPGAPNPMTTPALPIPFTARELAASMLDGVGRQIQDVPNRRIGYALDDTALQNLGSYSRWVREALIEAYDVARQAQDVVGDFKREPLQKRAQYLVAELDKEVTLANERENVFEVFEPVLSNACAKLGEQPSVPKIKRPITSRVWERAGEDERSRRRERAIASTSKLRAQARKAEAKAIAALKAWRKAMVHQLLQPLETAPAQTAKAEIKHPKPVQRTAAQDTALLAAITEAGYSPLELPVNEPGKPGIKAALLKTLKGNPLFVGTTVFDKAWCRMHKAKDISYKI